MGSKPKIDDSVIEKIHALLATGKAKNAVAKELHLSPSTVDKYAKKLNADGFEELRKQKKAEFIEKAWEVVMLATEQAKMKISKAGPGEAAKVAGIFYDKIALAVGEATGRHEFSGADGQPFEVNIRVIE